MTGASFQISSITCCKKLNMNLKTQISFRYIKSFRFEKVLKFRISKYFEIFNNYMEGIIALMTGTDIFQPYWDLTLLFGREKHSCSRRTYMFKSHSDLKLLLVRNKRCHYWGLYFQFLLRSEFNQHKELDVSILKHIFQILYSSWL